MVEALIQAAEQGNTEKLAVIMREVKSLKLPKTGVEKLTLKVNAVWQEILHSVEIQAIVPVDPSELEKLAKAIRDKKERKRRMKSEEPFSEVLFSAWKKIWKDKISEIFLPEVIATHNTETIRNLLVQYPKVPGFQFRHKGELIWCMFLLQGQELIFLKREIAEHPITSWEFIRYMRKEHRKFLKKYVEKKQS